MLSAAGELLLCSVRSIPIFFREGVDGHLERCTEFQCRVKISTVLPRQRPANSMEGVGKSVDDPAETESAAVVLICESY